MLKFLLFIDSSGSLLLLKLSRSSRNRSIDPSALCLLFTNLIIAWWPFIPDPNRFNNFSKILSAVSRSSSFFATTHFNAVPSRLLKIAVQACLSSLKLSCSRCSLTISTHASMQPSESPSKSFGFLKVFLDLPPPLSLESVFLVANAFKVLFIFSQVLAHVISWDPTLVFVVESPGTFVEFEVPPFMMVLAPVTLCLLQSGVTVWTTVYSVVVL